jgi:hypothetical protein
LCRVKALTIMRQQAAVSALVVALVAAVAVARERAPAASARIRTAPSLAAEVAEAE